VSVDSLHTNRGVESSGECRGVIDEGIISPGYPVVNHVYKPETLILTDELVKGTSLSRNHRQLVTFQVFTKTSKAVSPLSGIKYYIYFNGD